MNALVRLAIGVLIGSIIPWLGARAIRTRVHDYLDTSYPAWKLSSKTTGCNKDVERAVVVADFDGDRACDYVVRTISSSDDISRLTILTSANEYERCLLGSISCSG